MSTPSSQDSNNIRRGKTTLHGLKSTPKVLRPVQPPHVYDSYDDSPHEPRRREERRPRRGGGAVDLTELGMYAFFGLLGLGVVLYFVQGASTMEYDLSGETQEEIHRKNEEARRINEQRARDAALNPPKPVEREAPAIPPAARREAPAPGTTPAPVARPAVEVRPERPTLLGGISAGMVPPELQTKVPSEPRKDAPDAQVPSK